VLGGGLDIVGGGGGGIWVVRGRDSRGRDIMYVMEKQKSHTCFIEAIVGPPMNRRSGC
jgi:hypothetical protein